MLASWVENHLIPGTSGNVMQNPSYGVFDNPVTMQREFWRYGDLVSQWPATWCDNPLQTLLPWERTILEKPWGSFPPRPIE